MRIVQIILSACLLISLNDYSSASYNEYALEDHDNELKSIKNVNGKFYAYIVLLFNENPHFVNLIQKDSIPLRIMAQDGFNIKEYKNYLNTISERDVKKLARQIFQLYLDPKKFNDSDIKEIEHKLLKYNIIIQFIREQQAGTERISVNYCIFGKKEPINISHPLLSFKETIYNIMPYIYYDEFSTSNSTFYYDMIYINPVEVENDYIIAKKILNGENVRSYFFVGSRVTDNISYCLKKAFSDKHKIKDEIWKMFVIHELTHKILNNNYNNFDQVIGEELSLCSTMYSNIYLGLSVLYSYLNYNSINPHRIAAVNLINFIAERTKTPVLTKNNKILLSIDASTIKTITKEYFYMRLQELEK